MAKYKIEVNISDEWVDGIIILPGELRRKGHVIDGFEATGNPVADGAEILRRAAHWLVLHGDRWINKAKVCSDCE